MNVILRTLKKILRSPWAYVYVAIIPIVNWSFAHVPTIPMPDGGQWAPFAVVTGLVLVFRDFVQRDIGNLVFIPLIIGVIISYKMAGPEIAIYSGLAFAISEFVDWCVYNFTKRKFSTRVLISSAVSAPVDTAVFLMGANMVVPGIFSYSTMLTSIASKMFGAYIVYRIVRYNEKKEAVINASLGQTPVKKFRPRV
ncbi:MAG: VUT family protein [Alphaproteobacteria bacterium]|nr:VUT family protein [Alphaproteobacteria bacterium]